MKKRKFNLLLEIATLCLCVAAIAFGVYSAKTASLNVTGTIGFNAHNCNVYVYATLSGAADADGNTVTVKDFGTSDQYINVHDNTSAWEIGDIYFDDINNTDDSKLAKDITITISMYNESKYPVYAVFNKDNLGIDTTQISATASQAIVTLPANQTKADKTELTITFTVLKDSITALTLSADKPLVKFTKDYPMPDKGDLITMDLQIGKMESNEYGKIYRVLKTEGTKALVMSMYDIYNDGDGVVYNNDTTNTATDSNGNTVVKYEGSNLDTYLTNLYNAMTNENAKNAIVDTEITQYSYSAKTSNYAAEPDGSSPIYTVGNSLKRKFFTIDANDIFEYYDKTNITSDELYEFFLGDLYGSKGNYTSAHTWLRSAIYALNIKGIDSSVQPYEDAFMINLSQCQFTINYVNEYDNEDGFVRARPAFTIDLSKVEWSL